MGKVGLGVSGAGILGLVDVYQFPKVYASAMIHTSGTLDCSIAPVASSVGSVEGFESSSGGKLDCWAPIEVSSLLGRPYGIAWMKGRVLNRKAKRG